MDGVRSRPIWAFLTGAVRQRGDVQPAPVLADEGVSARADARQLPQDLRSLLRPSVRADIAAWPDHDGGVRRARLPACLFSRASATACAGAGALPFNNAAYGQRGDPHLRLDRHPWP